jgi:hypothetical protein
MHVLLLYLLYLIQCKCYINSCYTELFREWQESCTCSVEMHFFLSVFHQ